jgi:4-hydroxythreonine-4-phosphate dehydrogenase
MGDPSGIGAELVVKVLAEAEAYKRCRPFVVADPRVISLATEITGIDLEVRSISKVSEAKFRHRELEVIMPKDVNVPRVEWGRLSPEMGKASILCLKEAYELARSGEVDGVVSAPLNKEAFHKAGYDFSDELQYLKHITNSSETYILGLAGEFWTVTVTEHVPFRSIPDLITEENVLICIRRLNNVLRCMAYSHPRIAVAALNVHGGEGGLYGREELDELRPAIERARGEGIDVNGPVPADAVFVLAIEGKYDGIVCMYHDQANIARKLHAKRSGATIFMGLPVPCGTTAHGTGFDIAGKGIAEPGSLREALIRTVLLASGRDQSS